MLRNREDLERMSFTSEYAVKIPINVRSSGHSPGYYRSRTKQRNAGKSIAYLTLPIVAPACSTHPLAYSLA